MDTVTDATEPTDNQGAGSWRIGPRIKAARLARRKTLADLAAESGLTKGFISKLERDQARASVASLIKLCHALNISVASLFHGPSGEVVRRAEYPPINFGGTGMSEYLLTPHVERRLQVILSVIQPGGGSGDEPYVLTTDVEFAFVLEGRLKIDVGDKSVTLEAGDAFTFPGHTQHTFQSVETNGLTKVLWVLCPSLPVEEKTQD